MRAGIWLVTLGVNALVPVVKRRSAGLRLDDPSPWIFARWLVEMAVNNECGHGLIRTQATKRHKGFKRFKSRQAPHRLAQTSQKTLLCFLCLFVAPHLFLSLSTCYCERV